MRFEALDFNTGHCFQNAMGDLSGGLVLGKRVGIVEGIICVQYMSELEHSQSVKSQMLGCSTERVPAIARR